MELNSKRRGKPKINLTQVASIKGPKGQVEIELADFVKIKMEDPDPQAGDGAVRKAIVTVEKEDVEHQRQMWGTTRGLLNNGVIGVSEGHISIIKLVGTGFRASLEKDKTTNKEYLSLKVGYCVPMRVDVPEGISVKLPLPHRIILEGNDKQQVRLLAANIRRFRKPEPYKGKGVFVDGETIQLKTRKIK